MSLARRVYAALVDRGRRLMVRRRMHSLAAFLVWIRAWEPKLLRHLETLECRVAEQERELRALRWTLQGEQMGRWDEELDIREWRTRKGAGHPRRE